MSSRHFKKGLAPQPLNFVEESPPAELWDAWRLAEIESGFALNKWYSASNGDKARAYAAYTAALEREALAADLLAQPLQRSSGLEFDGALAAS
jgi:hypothetical protein